MGFKPSDYSNELSLDFEHLLGSITCPFRGLMALQILLYSCGLFFFPLTYETEESEREATSEFNSIKYIMSYYKISISMEHCRGLY